MALTEIYVDPSIAADSGAGTVGDPYGDLEYAIEQETFDTTNGTRVNIKAGTDEILAASLQTAIADTSVSVAWAPGATAPLIFQGYTATAGDGGIGGISGGGSVGIIGGAALDYISFVDLHLHNTGAADVIDLDNDCNIINCEVDNTTGAGISLDTHAYVSNCYVHNVGGLGIWAFDGAIELCKLENGTNKFTNAIQMNGSEVCVIHRNIIDIDSTSIGIDGRPNNVILNNSIYSNGGTGTGILINGAGHVKAVRNNVVEGFSGAGGVGIDMTDADMILISYGANSVYNCTTEYSGTQRTVKSYGSNDTLTVSPFISASTGNFSPVDTGNVKEGSLPSSFNEG